MSDAANAAQRVRAALQRATQRIKDLEAQNREPIAVIGMACRLPGGDNPDHFWSTLLAGEDRVRDIPDARLIGPWPEGVPRWAGLVDDVEGFDPAFFGIAPREALSLDPQQRLLLELSWEALENARVVPAKLRGSKTGVFVGLCSTDYQRRTLTRPADERDSYDTTGNMVSTATGRISYVLGLQGPAVSIDTACSSSLVAIHFACQSLRTRDCDLGLAGGINLILSEESSRTLSFIQALSPDGRCKTFDSAANGFVRGEGCGLLVLKRLSDAQRDADDILAVIRGSALNQDGRSTGLTAPNVAAQEALLRDALANAGVRAQDVGYVECHGTGTSLGDPIEVDALKAVFGGARSDGSKLWLGAVKTNIGHLEGAAGVASMIKVLQAFKHEKIPPNLHLRRMNPRIKLAGTALAAVTETVDWQPIAGRRIASVSSFGISGTNAHVILEQAPPMNAPVRERPWGASVPVLLSARSEAALRAQAGRLAAHLRSGVEIDPLDLGYSLATTRTHFEYRACMLAGQIEADLADLADRGLSARVVSGIAKPALERAVLFTGQGAQRLGMGKQLSVAFPAFRGAFETVCQQFDKWLERPLLDVIHGAPDSADGELLNQTRYTQPALFAFEVALYRLFESLGITAQLLLGHSIGELTAASIAGVWNLEHAVALVAARGRLMQELPHGGGMLSIQASEAEVLPLLQSYQGVDIAGLNGPLSTVVSGDEAPLAALEREFSERGRKTKRLVVSQAFHSHRMEPMLESFRRVAESITYNPPSIPIISNVTGQLATTEQLTSPDYWVRHIRQPVRFLDGVQALQRAGVGLCLELGPRPVLSSMAAGCFSEAGVAPELVSAGCKDELEVEATVSALGSLHCHGLAVDWPRFFADSDARPVRLPTYAFQRDRYWLAGHLVDDVPVSTRSGQPAPTPTDWSSSTLSASAPLEGTWMVVVSPALEDSPLHRSMIAAIESAGGRCHVCVVAPELEHAAQVELFGQRLSQVAPDVVLSSLAFEESPAPDESGPVGLAININLVHAIREQPKPAATWLLTRDAVLLDGAPPGNETQAVTWAHANLWAQDTVNLLDISQEPDAEVGERISRVVASHSHTGGSARLALRGETLFHRQAAPVVDDGSARRSAELRSELAGMTEPDRARRLLRLTVRQVADVLGHRDAANVSPDTDFTALGFDSLMAVELYKRLSVETGLKLRATVTYDHPSPRKLSTALLDALREHEPAQPAAAQPDPDQQLREALASLSVEQLRAAGLLEPLLALAAVPTPAADDYDQLSEDELLDAADALLGDI